MAEWPACRSLTRLTAVLALIVLLPLQSGAPSTCERCFEQYEDKQGACAELPDLDEALCLAQAFGELQGCLETCDPTAVELVSFTAKVGSDGSVTLTWQTATEVDNAGFNLYRTATAGGPYAKITGAIIPAQGNAVAGASYSFVDTPGAGLFHYLLEDLDTAGVRTLHGPIWVTVGSWPRP